MFKNFGDDKRFKFLIRPVMNWGGEKIDGFKDNIIGDNILNKVYSFFYVKSIYVKKTRNIY